jgi:hypothetical protein
LLRAVPELLVGHGARSPHVRSETSAGAQAKLVSAKAWTTRADARGPEYLRAGALRSFQAAESGLKAAANLAATASR